MKYFIYCLCIFSLLVSCSNHSKLVDKTFVDSLTMNYTLPRQIADNNTDMQFWKGRLDPKLPGQVNESRYAGTLITRFHQFGDINDVKAAEAVYKSIIKTYNGKLASPFVALTSSAMLQHRFALADTLLQTAKKLGIDGFTNNTLSFDVNFEIGHYTEAAVYLRKLAFQKDYSYYFRRSKYDHYSSVIDKAISNMLKAASLAKSSPYLKGIALSNAGDLYIHAGDLEKAAGMYKESIQLNSADFHSILGLGWVTLVHDKNDSLAERLFKFVQTKTKLPDPIFKLYQMAEGRGDAALEKQYATEFVNKAADTLYGRMYNKYVIEIYSGILNNPAKAEVIAMDELKNRITPQTFAWYAYTLFKNGKNKEAYKVFQKYVSGQPLEGLELYYMGKLMAGLGKGFNAQEFFKAADKNKYDLSPAMAKDLASNLEQ